MARMKGDDLFHSDGWAPGDDPPLPDAPGERGEPTERPPDDVVGEQILPSAEEADPLAVLCRAARWRNEGANRAMEVLARSKNVFRTQEGELIWVYTHPGTPTRFRSLDPESLAGVFADLGATFWAYTTPKKDDEEDKDSPRVREIAAPKMMLNRILSGCFPIPIPILAGIAPGPYLLRSGEVVTEASYCAESRLWLADSGTVPFKIGKGPGCLRPHGFNQEEAAAGLAKIGADLKNFPFATRDRDPDAPELQGLDESVAFAYALTLVARPACDTVPFFLFDAPLSGSGKDLLMKCFEILAYGKFAKRITMIGDDYQDKNEIAAALALGASHIVLGDLRDKTADNKTLFNLVTEGSNYGIRKLGKNDEGILVPANLVLGATGHNVQFREQDMYRRTFQCRLAPDTPNPEDRPTEKSEAALRAHFAANRGRYLAILFNVLRGYLHHRKTHPLPDKLPCPSFAEWGELVQGALVWAGMTDPMRSLTRMRARGATSMGSGTMRRLVLAWWKRFGGLEMKCKGLYAAHDADPDGADRDVQDLRDALRNIQEKPLTERALGVYLSSQDDTPFAVPDGYGGMCDVKIHIRDSCGSNSYTLIKVKKKTAGSTP